MTKDVKMAAQMSVSKEGYAGRIEVVAGPTAVGDALRRRRLGSPPRVCRQTVADIARRYGATGSQIYDWRRRFRRGLLAAPKEDVASPAFVPLTVGGDLQRTPHADIVEVAIGVAGWANVHRELKRKHVTLTILWDEYIAENPGGYRYSRFCELYRAFARTFSVTMRQTHAAGERLFVDYAGDGVPVVVDRLTGEVRMGQIFVAVLGASSVGGRARSGSTAAFVC